MEPLFYYDLGKNRVSKNWKGVFIALGIGFIIIFSIDLVVTIRKEDNDFLDFFTPIFQILYGVFIILYGTGKFYKKGKYFLKITSDEISYCLPSAKPRIFPIEQIGMIYMTSTYIFFKLNNGAQDTIEFRALNYEAATQFKTALQQMGLPETILQMA